MMETLVNHFMNEYGITRDEAVELLYESLSDFEVMKSILKAAYLKNAS